MAKSTTQKARTATLGDQKVLRGTGGEIHQTAGNGVETLTTA